MSAADSGLIIVAAPVIVTVGVVSIAGSAITATAEKYRRFRFDQAKTEELQRKSELDFIRNLAEENRKEYESILAERFSEESARQNKEELLLEAVRSRTNAEMHEQERMRREIHLKIEHMENAIRMFEEEFGEDQTLREMSLTIRRSEELFGDGMELLQELEDLVYVVIPGMAEERREEHREKEIREKIARAVTDRQHVMDTSETFVSLYQSKESGENNSSRTPWERFMERVQNVASVEAAYFESGASDILAEAEELPLNRRNIYLQQHQLQLIEMEERAAEFRSQQQKLSDQVMDDFCRYISIVRQLGISPQYTEEDLMDPFAIADMRRDTEDLVEEFKKVKERQYTVHAFTSVMKRHNLHFENMNVDDGGRTELEYTMDTQTGVRISRSESGAFEMQFQGKSRSVEASIDEKRSMTEKAKHFCSLLPEIVKELEEEYGITFDQTSLQPPVVENIEIRQAASGKRYERARTAKAMQIK